MAKQLNVNLAMTADTSKAKQELQSLQKQLDQLMLSASKKNGEFGISQEMQKATQLAAQLKVQLESATSSTGNLDLTKFTNQLKQSNTSITDYKNALVSLGPAGTQAFSNLASSIMKAEVPLRRANTKLNEFATTLKNTARWQISSSILHGFMGALQGAYGYAQDLNESLNNIRIVTGQSVDQMARFADQANKAARQLSTTTTAYTDAALIYYQQGLSDEAVKARTDVTIKLANVSRQSAEEVSSQMTAIWNNFDDGSKSMEYYADVITALGAATASSSDEIAQGLQKFASVADTVGLSYEKATAALATVVAETRQSAEVVGTAFRTMFARFQGLQLGETLDDGVTLNKYSAALATIGVNILDANGKLKDMDSILDETAEKWNTIDEAQQVALAETVAGTRQYAQFMAIMNNYDKVLANQGIASGAEGTLQRQADTFAESWEAAGKRVKAAAQGIYQDLLDDKFFIKLLNGFEKALKAVDEFIDGIGGLKTLLPLIGSIFMQVFNQQIQTSLRNTIASFQMMSAGGRKAAEDTRNSTIANMMDAATSQMNNGEGQAIRTQLEEQSKLYTVIREKAETLTEEQLKQAQLHMDLIDRLGQEAIESGKNYDAQVKITQELEKQQQRQAMRVGGYAGKRAVAGAQSELANQFRAAEEAADIFYNKLNNQKIDKSNIESYKQSILDMCSKFKNANIEGTEFNITLMGLSRALQNGNMTMAAGIFERLAGMIDGATVSTEQYEQILRSVGISEERAAEMAQELADSHQEISLAAITSKENLEKMKNAAEGSRNSIQSMKTEVDMVALSITALSSVIMSTVSAIRAIQNLGNIWSNDDLTAGEKILQTLSAMTMVIPLITTLTSKNTVAFAANLIAKIANTTATAEETAAESADAVAKGANTGATELETKATIKSTLVKNAETVATKGATAANLSFGASLGLVLAVIGPIIVAIGALAFAYSHFEKQQQAKIDLAKEEAETAKKVSEETKKQIEANNELVDSYKSALDVYDGTIQSKENLEKAALKVAEAYKIVNKELLIQTGNYKELTKAIQEAQIAEQEQQLKNANDEIKAQYGVFEAEAERAAFLGGTKSYGGAHRYSDATTQRFYFGGGSGNNKEINDLLARQGYSTLRSSGGQLSISTQNSAYGLMQAYEEVSDAIKQIQSSGIKHFTDETEYQKLVAFKKELNETYESLKTLTDERKQYQIEINTSPLINNAEINNLNDYEKLLTEVKRSLGGNIVSPGEVDKIATGLLKANAATSTYATTYAALLEKAKQLPINFQELKDYYDEYGDLVFSFTPDMFESTKAFDNGIAELQRQADQTEIQVKLIAYQSAQKDWKENMTVDEIKAFFETYENLFASEQEKIDFLNKTFIEQQKMLFEGEASNTAGLYNSQNLSGLDAEYARIAQNQVAQKGLTDASTLQEVTVAVSKLNEAGLDSSDALAEKIKELAGSYDSCTSEIAEYEKALAESGKGTTQAIAAQDKLVKALQQAEINEVADEVAKLTENLEELTDVEKQDVYAKVGNQLEKVFGHGEKLTSDFIQKNWGLIDTFLNTAGDESKKAANEIYEQLATAEERHQEAIAQARANNKDVEFVATLNDEQFTIVWGDILDRFSQLDGAEAILNAFLDGRADISQILASFSQIENGAQIVADYLASIGNTDLTAVVEQKAKILSDISDIQSNLASKDNITAGDVDSAVAQIQALQQQLDALNGTKIKIQGRYPRIGRANMSSTGSGGKSSGGGGSSAKHTTKDAKAAAEEQDRYHEIKEVISDLTRAIDNLSKAKDRAFGKSRIQFIEQETAALNKQREAQEKYIDEIKQNLSLDKGAAMAGVGYAGVGIAFDSENRISNYNEILAAAVNKYNQDVAWWNGLSAEAQQDEANQAKWEGIEEAYANVKDSMNQYEETLNLLEDAYDEAQDLFYQWQDLNAEKLNYEIEVKIKLNDADLKQLQLISKVLGDSLYKIPEVMQNLFTINGESQYQKFLQGAADYKQFWEDAQAAYAAGEISQAAFIEMLGQARDGIQSEIEALLQMNEQMREFYSQTLQKALKEIQNITDQMAHQASVIEHLKNLLSLSGREKDYAALNTLLEGATKIAENTWQTSKAQFEMFQENAEHAKEVYADILRTSEEGARQYKEAVLDPAIEQARAAEEQMYADAEDFLNKANALFENSLKKAQADAEEYLTNGLGWDYLADSMDRAQAIQDEYLTKTNQIYETNDLLRKLSQDIDKADSTMAKNKLKNFADEIQAMQDQEKLSQTDLAIAKARYELLLAQIALEDAQNAKSTVRLQRDNEGNYGYVYTADMDAIGDAQSAVADRQNDLYNLALQQANDYAAKILETEQQKNEALIALAEEYHNDASMSEEEYQRKRAEIIQQYDDLLYAQRDSYYKAIGLLDDVAVTNHNEAWTSDYEDLIDKGAQYTEDTTGFIDEIDEAIRLSNEARALVVADAELGLDSLDEKTRTLTEANDELARELMDNVLPSVDSVLDEVDSLTDAWARHYDEIMTTIQGYMQLIATMNEVMRVEAQRDAQMSSRSTDVPATMPAASSGGATGGSSGGSGGGSGGGAGGSGSGDLHTYTVRAVGDINYSNGSYQTLINTTNASAAYETYSTACGSGRYSLVELLKDGQRQQMWTSSSAGGSWSNTTGQKNAPYAYASGGYTGAWSDGGVQDGKLAILHQKELVLNEDDTENFLAAIKIVRQISDVIGQRAAYQGGASGLSSPFFNSSNSMLEQQVTIHAEFPNATSHSEIEEAFDNLINRASQYAGRPTVMPRKFATI